MAKRNEAFSLDFIDNSGECSWSANPNCADDLLRHYKIYGKWRSRLMFFMRLWKALKWLERYTFTPKTEWNTVPPPEHFGLNLHSEVGEE